MIDEILDKVKEGIVGKITGYVQEVNEKKILEQQIIEHLDREFKSFDKSSLDVKFDYQGLIDFLCGPFLSDEIDRILAIDQQQVERTKATITARAIAAANATTDSSEDTIEHIVESIIDAARSFYLEKVSRSDKTALSEATAFLSTKIEQSTEAIRAEIKDSDPENSILLEIQRLKLEEMRASAEKRKRTELKDKIKKYVYDSVAVKTGRVANVFGITNQEAFDFLRELAMEGNVTPAGQMRVDNPSLTWLMRTK